MSWQLVQMEEDVGMSECETHEEPPSPAKVTRDRKTSCLCVCAYVCGLVCVYMDQQLGESAGAST